MERKVAVRLGPERWARCEPKKRMSPCCAGVLGVFRCRYAKRGCVEVKGRGEEGRKHTGFKGHRHPLVGCLPVWMDPPALNELHFRSVRAGDDLQAAIRGGRGVDGEVGGCVLEFADVVVGGGVEVGVEAVSVGAFVVYLVFEEEHVLIRFVRPLCGMRYIYMPAARCLPKNICD